MDRFEEAKLKIKDAVDLPEMIQGFVALTRRGRYFVGLCPFHAEKTPSFTVYPETQHFKCYGCGKAGDAFSFLMEREGLSFREAMEQLADEHQIDLEGVFGSGKGRPRAPKIDFHGALSQVRDFFSAYLKGPDGRVGREYLADRDLLEAIDDFHIGLHPAMPGALRRFADQRKLPIDVLVQAGVLGRDGRREPLLGRVIFPIVDERDRVVGFGGRILPGEVDDRRPKYINSPESPWFNKRRVLYGLRQAKTAGTRKIVVVEGYTDVIACHLVGLTGTVATLGTALTLDHAKMLSRYATDGVVLLFDGDRAGRQAAERAFRELVHTDLSVRVALLPEGRDPADLCVDGDGAETGLQRVIDTAPDALTMWFRLLRQRLDLTVDADVQRAAAECGQILGEVTNPARREALQRNMSRHLGISEGALQPGKPRRRREDPDEAPMDRPASAPVRRRPPTKFEEADCDLVACALIEPGILERPEFLELRGVGFVTPRMNDVFDWIAASREAGADSVDAMAKFVMARAGEDDAMRRFLAECIDRSRRVRDVDGTFLTLRQGRQFHYAREQAQQVRMRLNQALADGDRELADQLTEHYMTLLRKSRDPDPEPN